MFKRVLINSAIAIALCVSAYAGGNFKKLEEKETTAVKQIKIENDNKSNVVVRELKNEQPVDTVYSEVKVEYADVKTIERLKRAVVILIEKVENFEKKVDAKEGRSIVKKSIPKSSKYDKKIEEFLNKENSLK